MQSLDENFLKSLTITVDQFTKHISITIEIMVGPFSISDIELACPSVSSDTIRLVLRQLRDEGAIIPQGKGRGAKWIRILT